MYGYAAKAVFALPGGEPSVYLAWRKPSVCLAWRLPANPAFTPLGGCPQTQHLSSLAATHKPSIYPAWRPPANPAFIPLGAS